MRNLDEINGWDKVDKLPYKEFTCYECGNNICSNEGYEYNKKVMLKDGIHVNRGYIYICHKCKSPTYFDTNKNQYPGALYGESVSYLPKEVEIIYNEARRCFSVNAFTSSVLCCRKILMSISCEKGAKEGLSFIEYVNYLNESGYIPPDGKDWVDKIRKLGNQATHKLETKSKEDAELAIKFTWMLLKFIYEFPNLLKE